MASAEGMCRRQLSVLGLAFQAQPSSDQAPRYLAKDKRPQTMKMEPLMMWAAQPCTRKRVRRVGLQGQQRLG